jgi:hypothetical protein
VPRDPPVASFIDATEAAMAQHHRRRRHLLNLWDRRGRILREAELQQEDERRAAVRRILEQATRPLPVYAAPLLTPGQESRSQR